MKYIGSRLRKLVKEERGGYHDLAVRMLKHRAPRVNGAKDEYNLVPLFRDGHNLTLSTLSAIMLETGMPITYFVDFEPGELPPLYSSGINGSNNVINSSISNDLTAKVDHLNEVIRLKDTMIADKDKLLAMKDVEIEQWKKRLDDVIDLVKTGKLSEIHK